MKKIMIKRVLTSMLILTLLLSLCGCTSVKLNSHQEIEYPEENYNTKETINTANILRYFLENEFENQELTYKDDISKSLNDVKKTSTYFQKTIQYIFKDMDNDGDDELIITSSPIGAKYDFHYVTSMWDCDKDGHIYNVFAKNGYGSRFAYRYFIAQYDNENYLLELTGGSNSESLTKIRNAYKYNGRELELICSIFYEEYYNDLKYKSRFFINDQDCSYEYAKQYLEKFDSNFEIVYNVSTIHDKS